MDVIGKNLQVHCRNEENINVFKNSIKDMLGNNQAGKL